MDISSGYPNTKKNPDLVGF